MSTPRPAELPKERRDMVEPDTVRYPREGWSSLALFLIMLLSVAVAVDDADWAGMGPGLGRQTGFLPIAAVLAGLIAFVLAKSRLGAVMAHTLGAVLGSTFLLVAVSGSVSSEPALADRLRALAESTEIFYDDLVVLGIRSSETSVFLLLLGTLLWAVSQFGAFNLFRRGRAMPAVVAAGLALLINMSITVRLQYLHLIVFSAAAMLLLVRLNLLVQQEGWRRRWIVDTGQVSSLFMRGGIVFVLLTLTGSIALAATASSAPLANAWRNADDHLLNIGAEVNRLVGGVTGASRGPSGLFSSSQTIRGVWESSSDVVFRATSTDYEGHYWRGAVYDHFDGFTWQQLGRTRLDVPAGADLLAESFDSVLDEDGRKRVTLTVTSVDLAGGTLLSPETPLVVDRDAEVLTNDPAGPLVAIDLRDAIDPGESFTVTSMVPDPDADEDELVTAADLAAAGIEYPSWTRRFIEIRPGSIGDLTYQTADQIVALLPADERDPYHVADAMQSFLYRDGGFQYNTDVRGLCGRDKVVDCFLTTRVGYCEHFATTMVMLLRTQQIPARLAMGYLPGREVAEGSWEVDRSAAHAWVEVYFPSYGWIKFDPTPGNAENGQEPTQLARGEPTPRQDRPPGPISTPRFDLEDPRGDAGPPVPPIDPTGGGLPQAPPPADPGPIAALAIGAILISIAVVALLTRLRRMPSPEPDLAYRGVARLAGRFGYGPQPTQTAYEYAGTLSALLPAVRSELAVVARAKVETTYARRAPDAQMLEQLRAAYRRVRIGLLRLIFRRRFGPSGPRDLGSRSGRQRP
ncbi:MAG: transglutaminaseTgpA domain-containing protein [Chloroflexota bacterium]|nr:transglutaminaseTgpA domain-containing protein [Chloroflexota bacterium]